MNDPQLLYKIAIGLIPGVGSHLTRLLVSYCGTPRDVFKANKGKLLKIPGIGPSIAEAIINQNILKKSEDEINKSIKENTTILFYTDADFPSRLKHLHDAPTLLYFKGSDLKGLNEKHAIAVVGTRKASTYGIAATEEIIKALSPFNPLIISGLAYGIDITAHKAALNNNLNTIGVMASGINIIYPSGHKKVASQMIENGGLITEYSIGAIPETNNFPARNRIIAGLAEATIVVEAAEKGGALITAEIANSYNREVFAVPGNLGINTSLGCNKLIKNHKANIFTRVEDIIELLHWQISDNSTPSTKPNSSLYNFSTLNNEEQTIVSILKENQELMIDELSWKSQVPASKLASLLLNLEFQGVIKALPGKKFKLNH